MTPLEWLGTLAAVVYAGAILLLAIYAGHGLWLLRRFARRRREALAAERAERAGPPIPDHELPRVLVQLPVYNERDVVEGLIDACARLDWPRDRLAVQVLDDSTDDTVELVGAAVARHRAAGLDVVHLHREDRTGFKAGALEAGMRRDDAPFVAIFDADFRPDPDFLRRAYRPFVDDRDLALVQGRWAHLNRDRNLLTRVQAIGIDGHFAVEQSARAWSGLAMNFNGTCGMWRRAAIEDAGGWQHDTLTEDLDLSYRAQLRGWRCTYRMGLAVPGELPDSITAFRAQQFRWAKGSQQTARKLLRPLLSSGWSWKRKVAAWLHLTHYAVHPLILLSLVAAPVALCFAPMPPTWLLVAGMSLFLGGVCGPLLTYLTGQMVLHGAEGWRAVRHLPALAGLGTGIAVSNTRAVVQAWSGVRSPFLRTPKRGQGGGSYRSHGSSGAIELACAAWAGIGVLASVAVGRWWIIPLLAIFACGFCWVAIMLLRERLPGWIAAARAAPRGDLATTAVLAVCGCVALAAYVAIGTRTETWQYAPVTHAGLGLVAGAAYLVAAWRVLRAPVGLQGLLLILGFALAFRAATVPVADSDDLNRYLVEGVQVTRGENPYAVAPADVGPGVASAIDAEVFAGLNHPDWTAIYPPFTIWVEAAIASVHASVVTLATTNTLFEILAIAVLLALLRSRSLPAGLILLAAWNPVGPLWFAGEGHNDGLMILLIALGWLLCERGHRHGSSMLLTLATLAKPFAAVTLLPRLWRDPLHLIAVLALAILCYAPFLGAGAGLFDSLGRFGGEKHFHGALEPLYRLLLGSFVGEDLLQPAVLGMLLATLALGAIAILRRDDDEIRTGARLLVLLSCCLPTLHPWYLITVVAVLPLLGGGRWLLVWTAMAPVYWLHATAFPSPERYAESGWVLLLAHGPAAALLGLEVWRRARPPSGEVVAGGADRRGIEPA